MKNNYIISAELETEKIENFEKYPFNLPVVKNFEKIIFHKNVTFLL
jgi:predicted ATPase